MESKENESKKEFKELVIKVDKSLYDEIKKEGVDKYIRRMKRQSEYLLHTLLFDNDRDKELLSERAIGDIADISELLCKIQSVEDNKNMNLRYNYKYLDDFLGKHDLCYMKSLLTDIMCGYGVLANYGSDDDARSFVNNCFALNSINELISSIV